MQFFDSLRRVGTGHDIHGVFDIAQSFWVTPCVTFSFPHILPTKQDVLLFADCTHAHTVADAERRVCVTV